MKVKVGDKVKVIAGADRGKEGNVQKIFRDTDRVIVTGIHIVKKHMKPGRTNETGGILEVEAPIHISNIKVLVSSKREAAKAEKIVAKEKTKVEKQVKSLAKKEMISNIKNSAAKKTIKKVATKSNLTKKVGGSK